jgi:hypothetical protein
MQKIQWRAEVRDVNALIPWKENPRKITKVALEKLKEKIIQSGFHSVIVVDTDNTILSGNQRKTALTQLGIKEVPVLVPDRTLTNDERTKIALESNVNDGEWDFEKLKSFDLDLIKFAGFSDMEIAKFWDEDKDTKDDKFDVDKEIKKIKTPVVQKGDLIIMGDHKLLCASSTDIHAVQKLFGEHKATAIYSDPPFNIGLSYDKGVGNTRNYGGSFDVNQSPKEYVEFIRQVLKSALSVSVKDLHVAFCS